MITKEELAEAWVRLYEGHARPYTLQDGSMRSLKQRSRSVPGATVLNLIDEYIGGHSERASLIRELKHRLENPITRLYAGHSPRDHFLYGYVSPPLTRSLRGRIGATLSSVVRCG